MWSFGSNVVKTGPPVVILGVELEAEVEEEVEVEGMVKPRVTGGIVVCPDSTSS